MGSVIQVQKYTPPSPYTICCTKWILIYYDGVEAPDKTRNICSDELDVRYLFGRISYYFCSYDLAIYSDEFI